MCQLLYKSFGLVITLIHVFVLESLDFQFPKLLLVEAVLSHRQLIVGVELVGDLCD